MIARTQGVDAMVSILFGVMYKDSQVIIPCVTTINVLKNKESVTQWP